MLKPHAASWQQRRYSGSQSIKPCYANCKIIISVPTSAEYPNSHSISRIIPLCSFSISLSIPLPFLPRVLFFSPCDIFLSNGSSAKWIHKSGRKTSKQSIVKVKCWWSVLFLSLCCRAMRRHLQSALSLIASLCVVLLSVSKRNRTSGKGLLIKSLYLGGAFSSFCTWGSDQTSVKTLEQAPRRWFLFSTIVATEMVSDHGSRQRACWCQDRGPWPCHCITNTLSLFWGGGSGRNAVGN